MAKARHRLRALREQRRFTQESLAHHLNVGISTVRAWEQGVSTPFPENRGALADALGIDDKKLDAILNGNGVLPTVPAGWWSNYEVMEQSAIAIRTWEPMVVPGLLQTEPYASALLRDDELVSRRLARQAIVSRRENPVPLTAVFDESVSYRLVGGIDILTSQLHHLLNIAEQANVTLHVLPLGAEAKAIAVGGKGAFVILEPSWPGGLVHLEHTGGARSLDSFYEIDAHMEAFSRLQELALSPAGSIDLIRRRLKDLEQ